MGDRQFQHTHGIDGRLIHLVSLSPIAQSQLFYHAAFLRFIPSRRNLSKNNHAPEIGSPFLGDNLILIHNTEGGLLASEDRVGLIL